MKAHLEYGWYVIWHRWYVMLECFKYGLIWQGLIHDWHKFLPSEWFPYVAHFGGDATQKRDATGYYDPSAADAAFRRAFFLHTRRCWHHWQSWVMSRDHKDGGHEVPTLLAVHVEPMAMPERYWKEMICDWRGAGRAQNKPDTLAWYHANKNKIVLHPHTRVNVESELDYEKYARVNEPVDK